MSDGVCLCVCDEARPSLMSLSPLLQSAALSDGGEYKHDRLSSVPPLPSPHSPLVFPQFSVNDTADWSAVLGLQCGQLKVEVQTCSRLCCLTVDCLCRVLWLVSLSYLHTTSTLSLSHSLSFSH